VSNSSASADACRKWKAVGVTDAEKEALKAEMIVLAAGNCGQREFNLMTDLSRSDDYIN